MEVGVLVTTTAQSGDLAEVARRVEAEGFDSLWIPEHPVIPVGHQITHFLEQQMDNSQSIITAGLIRLLP